MVLTPHAKYCAENMAAGKLMGAQSNGKNDHMQVNVRQWGKYQLRLKMHQNKSLHLINDVTEC